MNTSTSSTEIALISTTQEAAPPPVPPGAPQNDTATSGRVPRGRAVSTVPSDRVLRSRAMNPTESVQDYHVKDRCLDRVAVDEFRATHFITTMPFTRSSHLATSEDMADTFLKEKLNWLKASAYKVIDQADLPRVSSSTPEHYWLSRDFQIQARWDTEGQNCPAWPHV
jgi:hypothetical protein